MARISIDPATLPALDIVGLANAGQILRVDHGGEAEAALAFVPAVDWQALQDHTNPEDDHEPRGRAQHVASGLQKCVPHLIAHIGTSCSAELRDPAGSVFTVPSDLFASGGVIVATFVRDKAHPVGCFLFGRPESVQDILRHEPS